MVYWSSCGIDQAAYLHEMLVADRCFWVVKERRREISDYKGVVLLYINYDSRR